MNNETRAIDKEFFLNSSSSLRNLDCFILDILKDFGIRYHMDDINKDLSHQFNRKVDLDADGYMKLIVSQGWTLGDFFKSMYGKTDEGKPILGKTTYIQDYDNILKWVVSNRPSEVNKIASAMSLYYDRDDMENCPVTMPQILETGKVHKQLPPLPLDIDKFNRNLMSKICYGIRNGYYGFTDWKTMAKILGIHESEYSHIKDAAEFLEIFKHSSYLDGYKLLRALEKMGSIGWVRYIAQYYDLYEYKIEAPKITFKPAPLGKREFPRSLNTMDKDELDDWFSYLKEKVSISGRNWMNFAFQDEPGVPYYFVEIYKDAKTFFAKWIRKYPYDSGFMFIKNIEKINYQSLYANLTAKYSLTNYYGWLKGGCEAQVDKRFLIGFKNIESITKLPKDYNDFPERLREYITRASDYSSIWTQIYQKENPRASYQKESEFFKNSEDYFANFREKHLEMSGYMLVKAIEEIGRKDMIGVIQEYHDLTEYKAWKDTGYILFPKVESRKRELNEKHEGGNQIILNNFGSISVEASPPKTRKPAYNISCYECKDTTLVPEYKSKSCGHTFCKECVVGLGLDRKADFYPLCPYCNVDSQGVVRLMD